MRSLLRLSLLRPTSSSFTSCTLSDVGEGRAVTAGMEVPGLDLLTGEEPGGRLSPQRRAPGRGCGQAVDQLPPSLPAWRCTPRNAVLLSTKTYFCLSSEPHGGYLHFLETKWSKERSSQNYCSWLVSRSLVKCAPSPKVSFSQLLLLEAHLGPCGLLAHRQSNGVISFPLLPELAQPQCLQASAASALPQRQASKPCALLRTTQN